MNVLIIESDMSVGSYFCETISRWGYNAEKVTSGQKALEKMKDNVYDVVILNTTLSDTRAADLIPRLKKSIPTADIVVMTKHNTARLERSIRKFGVVYYMTRLAPTDDLRSVLDHIS